MTQSNKVEDEQVDTVGILKEADKITLGILTGITEPVHVKMNARRPPKLFEYLVVESIEPNINTNKYFLSFVEDARTASNAFSNPSFVSDNEILNFETASEAAEAGMTDSRDRGYEGHLRIVGSISELIKGNFEAPRMALDPASRVYAAPVQLLNNIFSPKGEYDEFGRMGVLASNPDVEVSFDFNAVTNFRLGIFGITRYGKTNVALSCVKNYAQKGATMVIFDITGDYSTLDNADYNNNLNVVNARIGISTLSAEEFIELLNISDRADNQRAVLHQLFTEDLKTLDEGAFSRKLFLDLKTIAESTSREDRSLVTAARSLTNNLGPKLNRLSRVLSYGDCDTMKELKTDKINIINLRSLKTKQLDKAAGYYLKELYNRREKSMELDEKNTHIYLNTENGEFPTPVVVLLEEAQNFIPAEKGSNKTAAIYGREIAKMGAKYGLGLIIISQQPSKIDEDVMSQLNSKVVMRLVNDIDQNYILKTSESLSQDLVDHFPNFSKGIGLAVGPVGKIPTIIKFDEVKNRRMGVDLNPMKMWTERKAAKQKTEEEAKEAEEFKEKTKESADAYYKDFADKYIKDE